MYADTAAVQGAPPAGAYIPGIKRLTRPVFRVSGGRLRREAEGMTGVVNRAALGPLIPLQTTPKRPRTDQTGRAIGTENGGLRQVGEFADFLKDFASSRVEAVCKLSEGWKSLRPLSLRALAPA
jgi:hypothetical protein